MFFEGAISADSHVLEPPACFSDYIDPGYRDRAPRIELDGMGRHVYVIEGVSTQQLLAKHAANLSEAESRAILRDNVRELFRLPVPAA